MPGWLVLVLAGSSARLTGSRARLAGFSTGLASSSPVQAGTKAVWTL